MAITLTENTQTGIPINGAFQTPSTTNNQFYSPNSSGNVLSENTTYQAPKAPVQVAPKPVLNRAAVDNTQKSIDQLPLMLQMALDAEAAKYQNAENGFDIQQGEEQARYDEGSTTNNLNYDANLMASLRSGAKGLSGLLSILRGTGAEDWAREAVVETTNSDIRGGLDTRNENQTALDTSLGSFMSDLAGKRRANQETRINNEYAARGANASQMQDLYKTMAGFYSDAEDTAGAANWMNKAGDLSADVARYSTAPVGTYDQTPVKVKAAPITAFSGATNQNINADNGNNSPTNGVFTIGDTRKKLAGAGA